MNKRIIRSRRARYGSMALLLTILLVAVVVLFNAVFGSLANRYSWYLDLSQKLNYDVSDRCVQLLDSMLNAQEETVEIIFCNTETAWKNDSTQKYVYETAKQLEERFPQKIAIKCYDILLNPTPVKDFTEVTNPITGEKEEESLVSSSIIIHCKDYFRVYSLAEFFVFEGGDTSNLWAYNGEKKLAAGILHAIHPNGASVGMLKNHGEIFYDYELLYLLDDAGYTIRHLDLYTEEIPADCHLLISFNPNSDLTASDQLSVTSEADKLNSFLGTSGNTVLFFIESGTPSLPNLEAFLAAWGVETEYAESKTSNASFRYTVQDATKSLTSDGFTIYGQPTNLNKAVDFLGDSPNYVIFKNATALTAANGFVKQADGTYQKENRTLYSVYESGKNTVSWANGAAVDSRNVMLMTVTEQINADGKVSRVGVISSTDFATESFLQSAVYGNGETLMKFCAALGMKSVPLGLTLKPFQSTDISLITTSQMLTWTLILSIVPAVVFGALGTVLLVRRKNR